MRRTILHVRQDIADNAAAQATLKNEARTLLAMADRTAKQDARIDAASRELDALVAKEVDLRKEEVAALKSLEEEKAAGGPINGGTNAAASRPVGRRFVEMFGAQAVSADNWQSSNEFLSVMHAGLHDTRFRPAYQGSGLMALGTVGSPSDGGFSVPTQFVAEWLDASLESEIVRPRATVWPMTSDTRMVPGFDAMSAASSTLFGGFTANWTAEGAEIDPETAKLRAIELKARKLALLSQVSNELIADGLGYDQQLSRGIVRAMGWFLDDACLNGQGAGRPIGVINASCTISVAKETSQTAATINYTNLVKMFARMHPACIQNSVWVANNTTIPQLAQLSMAVGTGGSHIPVMSESDGKFYILTRPVIFTEKVPTLGTVGDIGLYDFSQYAIGLRKDMSLDKSQHPGFTRDTTYYRGLLRVDGMPTWPSAYTPKHGDSLSPFVVLATRG